MCTLLLRAPPAAVYSLINQRRGTLNFIDPVHILRDVHALVHNNANANVSNTPVPHGRFFSSSRVYYILIRGDDAARGPPRSRRVFRDFSCPVQANENVSRVVRLSHCAIVAHSMCVLITVYVEKRLSSIGYKSFSFFRNDICHIVTNKRRGPTRTQRRVMTFFERTDTGTRCSITFFNRFSQNCFPDVRNP